MQKNKYNAISQLLRDEKKLITTDQNAGRGAYGSVFFVHEIDFPEMKYAVKVQDIADSSQVRVCPTKLMHCIEEANNMRALNHKHVVTIHSDYIIDTYHFIQMNQCVQSLGNWSRNNNYIISNIQFKIYTNQILSAVEYIHSKNYVLRDLKLDNILLDADFSIKLCDFGSAKKYKDINQVNSDTNKGSLFYLPPEIQEQMCNSIRGDIVQTAQGDIWALGICFLFLGKADPLQFGDCYRDGWTIPSSPFLTEQAQQFAQFILIKDPNLRPTISQIRQKFDLDFNFQRIFEIERKSSTLKTDENNQFQKSHSISYPTKEATIYHERKKSTDYVPLTNQQNITNLKNTVNQYNLSSSFDNNNKSQNKTFTNDPNNNTLNFYQIDIKHNINDYSTISIGEINKPLSQNIQQYIIQPYTSTANNGNNQFHNTTLITTANNATNNHDISENIKNNIDNSLISEFKITPSANIPQNINMYNPNFTINLQNNQMSNRDSIENFRYSEPQQFNQNIIHNNAATNHYISENKKNNNDNSFISELIIPPLQNIPYNINMYNPNFTINLQNNQMSNRDSIENYRYSEPQQFYSNKIQTNNTKINENQHYYSSLDQRNDLKIELFQDAPTNHYISENKKNNFDNSFLNETTIVPSANIPYNANMYNPYLAINNQNNQMSNRDSIENYRQSEAQQFNQNKIQTNNTKISENQYYYSSLDQSIDPKIEFFQVIVNLFTWDKLNPIDYKKYNPIICNLSCICHLLICFRNIWKNPGDNLFLIITSLTYFIIVVLLFYKLTKHQYNRIFFMVALISWIISLLVSNQQDSLYFSFLHKVVSSPQMIFFLNEYYFQLENIFVLFLVEIICVLHLLFIGMTDSLELKYYFIGAIIMSVGILLQLENCLLSRPLLIRYLIQQNLYLSFQWLFLFFIQVILYLLFQADYAETFDYISLFLVTLEIYIPLTIWSVAAKINDQGNNGQIFALTLIKIFQIPNILLPFVMKESPIQIYKVCLVKYIIYNFIWIFIPVFKEKIAKIVLIISHASLFICTILLFVSSLNYQFLKGEIITEIIIVPDIASCLIIVYFCLNY